MTPGHLSVVHLCSGVWMVTRPKGDNMTNMLIKTPSVRLSEQAAVKQAIIDALIILGVTKVAKK